MSISLNGSANPKSVTFNSIDMSKVSFNGTNVWNKVVDTNVNLQATSYQQSSTHMGTDIKTLIYGPIDASLYKGIEITVTKSYAEQEWNTYTFSVGFGSGTDSNASNQNNMTATYGLGNGYRDYWGNQETHNDSTTRTITLNFAETSGNVYVFAGVISGNGYGTVSLAFNSTAKLLAR